MMARLLVASEPSLREGPMFCESVHMDPAELIDSRPNDAPLALWCDRIVLGVHHDGADAMPKEWKLMTDRLVHDILFGLTGTPPPMMTPGAEYWLT
jgi:hypothetical protein